MCGRFGTAEGFRSIATKLGAELRGPDTGPRYNVAPSQLVPVLLLDGGSRVLAPLRWGLRPPWARDGAPTPINARGEDAAVRPYFRSAFKGRRCLVPASGFYEWQKVPGAPKVPHWIHAPDGELLTFAGLWEAERRSDPAPSPTFCILTTVCSDLVRPVHDRMPVILSPAERDAWLDPATPADRLQALLRPYAGPLAAHPVSTRVNSPRNDGPELIEPVDPGAESTPSGATEEPHHA
jgi:putative SOS response-associated peptidase YedK